MSHYIRLDNDVVFIVCLTGLHEDREALFDIIHKSKNNYHKRAYQCIKMLTNLFSK